VLDLDLFGRSRVVHAEVLAELMLTTWVVGVVKKRKRDESKSKL
jgi:hypothetical protein